MDVLNDNNDDNNMDIDDSLNSDNKSNNGEEDNIDHDRLRELANYADENQSNSILGSELWEKSKEEIVKDYIVKRKFLWGTDKFGRDLFSRMVLGSRISLAIGFVSVFISLLLGVFMGGFAGFLGGRVDKIIVWLINVIWSIPSLLMVIAITLALGKGFWQVFVAVGLTMWVEVARLVRGQVISIKEKSFVINCQITCTVNC